MLKNYLKKSKALLENLLKIDSPQNSLIHDVKFVFGNESGDFDSIISSVSYAFHQSVIQNKNKAYIPVMNFKTKEIKSRFEINYLFKCFNYDTDDLIYLNSIDFDQFISKYPNTEIVLVDHNVPAETISRFKDRVTEIIDHHVDKSDSYPSEQIIEKEIKTVGSCSTLVFQRIYQEIQCYKEVEKDIFWFILSGILLDTNNFNLKEKDIRWNEMDVNAYKNVLGIIDNQDDRIKAFLDSDNKIDTNKMYDILMNLKFDEDMNLNLPLEDLFVKDYKTFKYTKVNVGYSVFLFSVDKMLEKYNFKHVLEETKKFDSENNLNLHFLMFVWPEKQGMGREFGCYCSDPKVLEGLKNYLILDMKLEFEEVNRVNGIDEIIFLRDKTSTYSRKIFEPYVSKFFA